MSTPIINIFTYGNLKLDELEIEVTTVHAVKV